MKKASSPKKILVVIESLGFGGAERLLVSLLPEIQKLGISCHVAALWPPYSLEKELKSYSIPVYHLDISSRFFFWQALGRLFRLVQKHKFDLVWGHLYFGNLYSPLLRFFSPTLKTVVTLHSSEFSTSSINTLWKKARVFFETKIMNLFGNRIVAVSQAVADDYSRSFEWKDIKVIHNGVPLKHLPERLNPQQRLKTRMEFGCPENEILFLTPARYAPEKGHDIMLRALQKLKQEKNWTPIWFAAGQGPQKELLEKKRDEMGLKEKIFFHGPLEQKKLFRLMQSCDGVVLPSIREPFGIAAAEAMGMGIPTILSSTDGLKELVGTGENAYMFEPQNASELANVLWEFKNNPAKVKKISENGRIRVRSNFDIPIVAQNWVDLFTKVLS